MVNTKQDITLFSKEVLIHGDVNREFVAVPIDPARKVMIERDGHASFPGHVRQHPEVVAIISPPEAVPFIIPATVTL